MWPKTANFYGGAPILNNVPSRIDPIYTDYLYLWYFSRFCSEYKKFPLINTVFKNDSLIHSFLNWGKTAHFHGGAPILNIFSFFFQLIVTHFPFLGYFSGFHSNFGEFPRDDKTLTLDRFYKMPKNGQFLRWGPHFLHTSINFSVLLH